MNAKIVPTNVDATIVPTKTPPAALPAFKKGKVAALAAAKLLAKKKRTAPRPPLTYQYHVGKGNNSRLILQALRKRPWFVPKNESSHQRVFVWEMYRNRKRFEKEKGRVACNHLEHNTCLVNKDGLYRTMRAYCDQEGREPMAQFMPLTFHLKSGKDEEHAAFRDAFAAHAVPVETQATNLWILKPASMSNRGFGIRVANDLAVGVRRPSVQLARRSYAIDAETLTSAGDRGDRDHGGAEGRAVRRLGRAEVHRAAAVN